ncbi:MAG: hypothetical protein H0U63_06395 [Burkholderiales bacterium]|nr:hypothetical protein [Burkholderiales bacterium]
MKFSQDGVNKCGDACGVLEMGGREWGDEEHMVTEATIRAFYAYYRKVMEL